MKYNEVCQSSQECGFGLGCYNSKCTKYGTLKAGTILTLHDYEWGFYEWDEFLCESYYAWYHDQDK